jgi:peroxiredoxin Q/BCP
MIETGRPAPDFALPDQDGETVRLSELRGRRVVLYFYPRADTPGCTAQACGVRDHQHDYDAAGATVLGVSPDTVAAVKRFHDKQGLTFRLLADEDHAVAEAWGVWRRPRGDGRPSTGITRSAFLVDEQGLIECGWYGVKAAETVPNAMAALDGRETAARPAPG